jgi:hypothetical protein
MQKRSHLLLLPGFFCLAGLLNNINANNATSHSTFTWRPPFQSPFPEKESLFHNDLIFAQNDLGGAVQIVPLGGSSIQEVEIARYFFPFEKDCLIIAEEEVLSSGITRDVAASHLNIRTQEGTFQSRVCIAPRQSIAGFGVTWRQKIARSWWIELSAPFLSIQHKLNLKEQIINNGGGVVEGIGLDNSPFVANAVQAFVQPSWKYGKLTQKSMEKKGLADIECKVGYQALGCGGCYLSSYAGLVIPTGNKHKDCYLWEPIVGNGQHLGFMYGSSLALDVWKYEDHEIRMEFDTNSRYLLSNHQIRSFDAVDKQWSRYMAVYSDKEAAETAAAEANPNSGTSGINVFSTCVKVEPRFSASFNSAFLYSYHKFLAEAGINFYARQAERVTFPWEKTPQFKDVTGEGNTNSARTIGIDFAGCSTSVSDYQPILRNNLNLDSAAHPAVISHTLYASLGGDICCGPIDLRIGCGGSYEWSHINTTLHQWLAWGKFIITY